MMLGGKIERIQMIAMNAASITATSPFNEGSDSNSTSTVKPYKCASCRYSFTRREHLQRHQALHSGEKRYQCACGVAFSRNDVLTRHLKGCERGKIGPIVKPARRARKRKSCDTCARLKSKCDSKKPCNQCTVKSFNCKYTTQEVDTIKLSAREDISIDPQHEQTIAPADGSLPMWQLQEEDPDVMDVFQTSTYPMNFPQIHEAIIASPGTNYSHSTTDFVDPNFTNDPGFIDAYDESMIGYDFQNVSMDFDLSTFCDTVLDGPSLPMLLNIVPDSFSPGSNFDSTDAALVAKTQRPSFQGAFSLEQIDPVEEKCNELRSLLKDSRRLLSEEIIAQCITREHLLRFIQSYGKDYSRNFPIIHSPTFALVNTPPLLLLAMFCVGACYCEGVISPSYIYKLAMKVLIDIENQPHETNMQMPSLSTIQASLLVCPVLVCSRDEIACKFVGVHFARNISMAKRAGLFESDKSDDYCSITIETFNWESWIEHELKKRLACAIFAHDIAGCIFEGKPPSLSPLRLHVELPSYESSWEAKSAEECLKRLQSTSAQPLMSTAVRQIRRANINELPAFEASGFGMFTILKGLHCLIWQATHYDLEPSLDPSSTTCKAQLQAISLESRLDHDLSGFVIASLADEVMTLQPSQVIKNANNDLDVWHALWSRCKHNDTEYEQRAFILDPLPFLWLAKLYLVLHCCSDLIRKDSAFANPRVESVGIQGRIQGMVKIVGWLRRFRRQPVVIDSKSMNCLPTLISP